MKRLLTLITSTIFLLLCYQRVQAAPYFYITGDANAYTGSDYTASVYLVTDGQTVTTAQTAVDFNTSYLTGKSISILNSRCTFWAPADGSLNNNNQPTPFFKNSNKAVFACGFSGGYQSSTVNGDLIARITFTPVQSGGTSIGFDTGNTKVLFIGTQIAAGAMASFNISIDGVAITPSPSPTATPTPSPTSTPLLGCNQSCSSDAQCSSGLTCVGSVCRNPSCSSQNSCVCPTTTPTPSPTASASATPAPTATSTGTGNVTTFTEDDLTFVEIGSGQSVSTVDSDGVVLEIIEEDDTLPGVPNLEPRARATPFIFSLLRGEDSDTNDGEAGGEVLAAQSLRELLIPGKSSADKTVVMVNLISTLTFLCILAIVIWRLITITRLNQLKSRHMKDLLASELASIESKLGSIDNPQGKETLKEDLNDTMQKLSGELEHK